MKYVCMLCDKVLVSTEGREEDSDSLIVAECYEEGMHHMMEAHNVSLKNAVKAARLACNYAPDCFVDGKGMP